MEVVLFIVIVGGLFLWGMKYSMVYTRQQIASQQKVPAVTPVAEFVYTQPVQSTVYEEDIEVPLYTGHVGPIPQWFIDKWVSELSVSPAEQLIIDELENYDVRWYREVSFVDMPRTVKGSNYRYDFWIPSKRTIMEYQGAEWHKDPERKEVDALKHRFCRAHMLNMVTYDRFDYYKLGARIEQLMDELDISSY